MINGINALLANWAEGRSAELASMRSLAAVAIHVWPSCQGDFGGWGPGSLANHTRTESHHGAPGYFLGKIRAFQEFSEQNQRVIPCASLQVPRPHSPALGGHTRPTETRTVVIGARQARGAARAGWCAGRRAGPGGRSSGRGIEAVPDGHAQCATLENSSRASGHCPQLPYLMLPRRPRRWLLGVGNRMCWAGAAHTPDGTAIGRTHAARRRPCEPPAMTQGETPTNRRRRVPRQTKSSDFGEH